jgi:hypothetical protein
MKAETKTAYDNQATTTKDSSRNSAHRKMKANKTMTVQAVRNTGEKKTRN